MGYVQLLSLELSRHCWLVLKIISDGKASGFTYQDVWVRKLRYNSDNKLLWKIILCYVTIPSLVQNYWKDFPRRK